VNVDVILDKPIDSAEQGLTVLGRIFALKTEEFLDSLPDFWRAYLVDHHFSYDAFQKKEAQYRWSEEVPKANKPIQDVPSESTKDPKHEDSHELATYPIGPGSGVKAPKPKYTPEPDFSEIAKYEENQGTVVVNVIVGTDGNVHNVRLLRPLGMGLDENAQSTVQTWRFQPAIRNGQPVAVEMNIEIAFDLF
jgi:TonB family protein